MKKTHIILLLLIAASIVVLISYTGDLTTYETIASAREKEGKFVNLIAKIDKTQPLVYDAVKDPNYLTFDSPPRGTGRSLMNGNFERSFSNGLSRQTGSVPGNLKSLNEINKLPSKNSEGLHLMVGNNVEHERFGKGKITQLEGSGADKKAIIFFPHHGSKTVLLRFANLKVID